MLHHVQRQKYAYFDFVIIVIERISCSTNGLMNTENAKPNNQ